MLAGIILIGGSFICYKDKIISGSILALVLMFNLIYAILNQLKLSETNNSMEDFSKDARLDVQNFTDCISLTNPINTIKFEQGLSNALGSITILKTVHFIANFVMLVPALINIMFLIYK